MLIEMDSSYDCSFRLGFKKVATNTRILFMMSAFLFFLDVIAIPGKGPNDIPLHQTTAFILKN